MSSLLSRDDSVWTRPHPKLENISPMTHLWNRFSGMYPGKWSRNFDTPEAIAAWEGAWSQAFIEEGLTPHDVGVGVSNCRKLYDWGPSLPEFLKACRPNLVPEAAFGEAVRGMIERNRQQIGTWSHPAIFWAAVRVTSHDLLSMGYVALKGRWENALRDVLAAGKWDPIPEAHIQLPAPERTERDRAEAAKRMAEMGATGLLDQRSKNKRAWAQRVVEKKGISPTVRAMAQRALESS